MVELIVVMILVGILGAIGAARFFSRTGFDAAAFAEQGAAMLRYGQKLAIAQNRPVYVQATAQGLALCYSGASPCANADRVASAAGESGGASLTLPAGATMTLSQSAAGSFYFNGLGRPYLATDSGAGDGGFPGLTLTIKGDDLTRVIAVEQETGYVH